MENAIETKQICINIFTNFLANKRLTNILQMRTTSYIMYYFIYIQNILHLNTNAFPTPSLIFRHNIKTILHTTVCEKHNAIKITRDTKNIQSSPITSINSWNPTLQLIQQSSNHFKFRRFVGLDLALFCLTLLFKLYAIAVDENPTL